MSNIHAEEIDDKIVNKLDTTNHNI
jgi:hypothetical protein